MSSGTERVMATYRALVEHGEPGSVWLYVSMLAEQRDEMLSALALIASRAAGCQLEPHDAKGNDPMPECVAIGDIYEWAKDAIARANGCE